MSAPSSTHARIADSSFAPHPLNEVDTTRAARTAEGVHRPIPSAQLFTAASGLAIDILAALSIGAFMAAVLIWGRRLRGEAVMDATTPSADPRRLSPSAAKLLEEMAEAERAVGDPRKAAILEMLLDWHAPDDDPISISSDAELIKQKRDAQAALLIASTKGVRTKIRALRK
jgi:hypothetical protein